MFRRLGEQIGDGRTVRYSAIWKTSPNHVNFVAVQRQCQGFILEMQMRFPSLDDDLTVRPVCTTVMSPALHDAACVGLIDDCLGTMRREKK